MRASSSVTVPVAIEQVVPHLADLSGYPQRMPMIHSIERDDDGAEVGWSVELRAKVGPFARSKRLRMVRTVSERSAGAARFVFDRRERGGGSHSVWRMSVDVVSAGERDPDAEGASGMSATKMREHAKNNNFKEFRKGIPNHVSNEHAKELLATANVSDDRTGVRTSEAESDLAPRRGGSRPSRSC